MYDRRNSPWFARPLGVGLVGALWFTGALALDLVAPSPVSAAPADDLLITFVARTCTDYSDVMANLARNNLMESLKDLGPDSTYTPDSIVNPAQEAQGAPSCRPLVGWRFAMGTSSQPKSPATLNLSTVTGEFPTDIVTTASTPELDPNGNSTGRALDGAVTVALSAAQRLVVAQGSPLWVQGGTPAAPLNNQQTTYGFAALRCATDAYNGDNVEKTYFPPSERHVFCYYYAVSPPPDSGTIIVNKQVAPGTNGAGTFRFDGSVSFADTNGDGTNDFLLTASAAEPGSETFIRGEVSPGDPPWTFAEQPLAGWLPPAPPLCTSSNGTSATTFDAAAGQVAVRLGGGDTVTCTYTNARNLAGPLSIQKETVGGTGSFPFVVDAPAPGTDVATTVTTTAEQTPVSVVSGVQAPPGQYNISETLPAPTPVGNWENESAFCDGTSLPVSSAGQVRSVSYTIAQGQSADCLLSNKFTPGGSIDIRKTTLGGVGTFAYNVFRLHTDPRSYPGATYRAKATTTQPGTSVLAGWLGPQAANLVAEPATSYAIQEQTPPISSAGFWRLDGVDCGANTTTVSQSVPTAVVVLDPAHPNAVCTFTNEFVPAGTLAVTKHTSADRGLRPSAATMKTMCSDGTTAELTVPPGAQTASASPVTFASGATCVIGESQTGAAPGVTVTTTGTYTVNNGPPQAFVLDATKVPVGPGDTVRVTVNNELAGLPAAMTSEGGTTVLANSGVDSQSPVLALFLVGAGIGFMALARRRRPSG